MLELRNPVNVLASPEEGYNHQPVYRATHIQLAFIHIAPVYSKLVGKNVVVTGSLFHAHTGHHYTDVLLNVRSIEPRSAAYARQRYDVCSILTSEFNRRQNFATSRSLLTEFRATVGDETTDKSFQHPAWRLIVNN